MNCNCSTTQNARQRRTTVSLLGDALPLTGEVPEYLDRARVTNAVDDDLLIPLTMDELEPLPSRSARPAPALNQAAAAVENDELALPILNMDELFGGDERGTRSVNPQQRKFEQGTRDGIEEGRRQKQDAADECEREQEEAERQRDELSELNRKRLGINSADALVNNEEVIVWNEATRMDTGEPVNAASEASDDDDILEIPS